MRPRNGRLLALACVVAGAASCACAVSAQTTGGREPPLLPLRFMEDVEAYCLEPGEEPPVTLKCLRLSDKDLPLISLGGELRWRVEAIRNPRFGQEVSDVVYPLQRVLAHADIRMSRHVRGFVQMGHHTRYGSDQLARPTDESDIDLQQGFVDVFWRRGPDDGGALRLGRQEFGFGSTRFIGAREGANLRLSFDAVLLSWQSPNRARVEVFAGRPVRNRPGAFDDAADADRAFRGIHGTVRLWGQSSFPERAGDQVLSLDLYHYGLDNAAARFADAAGRERRHAWGVRLFGRRSAFDLDWEAQLQDGKVGNTTVSAWTIATDTGWTADAMVWTLRLGVRADIASGDRRPDDGKLGSLQPFFASPAYFSEAALVAPVNLISVNPYLTVTSERGARLQVGWNHLFKHHAADAFYRPGPIVVPGTSGGSRQIASQWWAGMSVPLHRNFSLAGSVVHFDAGPAVRAGGGRNVDFATISLKAQF